MHASYLFLRTGSLWPSVTAHIFCNVMGIPEIVYEWSRYKWARWGEYRIFLFHIGSWILMAYRFLWDSNCKRVPYWDCRVCLHPRTMVKNRRKSLLAAGRKRSIHLWEILDVGQVHNIKAEFRHIGLTTAPWRLHGYMVTSQSLTLPSLRFHCSSLHLYM